MVTILPKQNDWSDEFQTIGQGPSEGYQNRSDQMALQKAVLDLGDNPPADKLLKAILGTKTYNPQSQQTFFNNALGEEKFKETQRHAKAVEEENNLKKSLEETKENTKKLSDMNDALTLIDAAKIPHEEKKVLRDKVEKGEASFNAIKEVLKPNKENIKNEEQAKSKELTQRAFNDIAKLIPEVGRSGIITSKLGGDTAKSYAKFTSLTGALEAILVEQVSGGRLSDVRFKYIVEQLLPKPSDTQSEITGKLEGLATMLDLDPKELGVKGKESKESNIYKLPPPSEYKGEEVEDSDGTTYYSDGDTWKKK